MNNATSQTEMTPMPDTNTSHRTMSNTRHAEILTQYDDLLAILDEEGPTIAAAKLSSSRDAFLSEYAPDEKTADAT